MSSSHLLPHRLSDLPPEGARLCLRVRRFLERLLPEARKASFVVAFSGGADSTALAIMLRCLGLPLSLAHLDHGLREESGAEAFAAARFAEALEVPFLSRKGNVAEQARQGSMGLEEAGRQVRYAFLEEVRARQGADWIAVGHHLDDLSEDVLMRLIRGAGWPGLGGMRALDRERRLIRPLLGLRKSELLLFLRLVGVTWTEDASNEGDAFRRNRVRHRIIPLLQEENPAFSRSIAALWELAREDEVFWEERLRPVLERIRKSEDGFLLPRSAFISLPRALRLRVFAALIRRLGVGQARAETLFELDAACMASRATKEFRFPGGIIVRTNREGLFASLRAGSGKGELPSLS